jgi:endonuclease YncB( thermonuclease family)
MGQCTSNNADRSRPKDSPPHSTCDGEEAAGTKAIKVPDAAAPDYAPSLKDPAPDVSAGSGYLDCHGAESSVPEIPEKKHLILPSPHTSENQVLTQPITPVSCSDSIQLRFEPWTGPPPIGKGVDVVTRVRYVFDAADHVYRTGQIPSEAPVSRGVFTRWYMGLVKPGKIYDGDTFTAGTVIRIPLRMSGPPGAQVAEAAQKPGTGLELAIATNIRMFGYNSPEIRCPASMPAAERESMKTAAVAARDALVHICKDSGVLTAIFVGSALDKYGRCLCVLYMSNGLNVNRWMLDHGHGVPYDALD